MSRIRRFRIIGFLCCVAANSLFAHAQSAKFETYSEAISHLLDLGSSDVNLFETDLFVTCRLFGEYPPVGDRPRVKDLPEFNLLSPELQAHCQELPANSAYGSSLGGGIGSSQSTRTVSQFENELVSAQNAEDSDPDQRFAFGRGFEIQLDQSMSVPVADFGPDVDPLNDWEKLSIADDRPSGNIRWSSATSAFFFTYSHGEIEKRATKYEDGFKADNDRFTAGATFRLNSAFAIGALGFYGEGDGSFEGANSAFNYEANVLDYYNALSSRIFAAFGKVARKITKTTVAQYMDP